MTVSTAIIALAQRLNVPAAHLGAVVAVECAGQGMLDGRPVIRLEVHLLWRYTQDAARDQVDARFRVGGTKPWEGHTWYTGSKWVPLHRSGRAGQAREWEAYACAKAIDPVATCRATSWGLGQVLGDYKTLGYVTPDELEAAAYTDAGQLDLVARYLRSRPGLIEYLRVGDWRTFAYVYNGPGKVEEYAAKLTQAVIDISKGSST